MCVVCGLWSVWCVFSLCCGGVCDMYAVICVVCVVCVSGGEWAQEPAGPCSQATPTDKRPFLQPRLPDLPSTQGTIKPN